MGSHPEYATGLDNDGQYAVHQSECVLRRSKKLVIGMFSEETRVDQCGAIESYSDC